MEEEVKEVSKNEEPEKTGTDDFDEYVEYMSSLDQDNSVEADDVVEIDW